MSWFRRKKKYYLKETDKTSMKIDGNPLPEMKNDKLPPIPPPTGKLYYLEAKPYEPPPYVEPTDKEMIEGLEMCGYYDEAYRIRNLKKENMVLKGKLTKLQKKYDACEADRQMYMKQLNHLHGK